MDFDRLTCSERWQCALVGGVPGWVAAAVVVIVGEPYDMLLASVLFVPVTVASGIVAGYLCDGGTRESAVVGGLAGGVAVLPAVLVPLFFFVMTFTAERGPAGWGLVLFVFTSVVFVVATLVAAALGALGGVAWGRHSSRGRRPRRARESGAQRSASWERGGGLDHELTGATARQDRSAGRTSGTTGRASAAGTSSRGTASSGGETEGPVTEGAESRWFYGLVGGLVSLILLPATIVLPFFPLGAVVWFFVGGGAAGYLQARDPRDGAIVGAFAGAVAIAPILAFLLVTHRGPWTDVVSLSIIGLPFAAAAIAFSTFGGAWGAVLSQRGHPEPDRRGDGSESVSRGGTDAGVSDPPGHSTGPASTDDRPITPEDDDATDLQE